MLVTHNPYQTYKQNQVNTATPGELTSMLYRGAIKFVIRSKQAMENQDMEQAHQNNLRVQEIITELMVTLNMDYEISQSLLQLYDYMKRRLIEANVKKDSAILAEVEGMLGELSATWSKAMKMGSKQESLG